jgi:hypothetical protein
MQNSKAVAGVGAVACFLGLAALLAWPAHVMAHCDALNGPVVMEAKTALEKGDVTPVLKWVGRDDEQEIRAAFKRTLAVRSQGPEAKALADRYFFETLVRLHRAGEGEPYTGLKPAGEVAAPIAAADKAIADGSVDDLAQKVGQAAAKSVRQRYERLVAAQKHKDDSVQAGREYVEAYVLFVHHVEGLHNAISGGGAHPH